MLNLLQRSLVSEVWSSSTRVLYQRVHPKFTLSDDLVVPMGADLENGMSSLSWRESYPKRRNQRSLRLGFPTGESSPETEDKKELLQG